MVKFKTIALREETIKDLESRRDASLPGVNISKLAQMSMDLYLSLVERGNILKARELAGDETLKRIGGK